MKSEKKGLAIIFHSGSYDRLYHGLSFALAGAALGRDVKLFFSYWALKCLKKENAPDLILDTEASAYKEVIAKNIEKGHIIKIKDAVHEAKAMGVKFYACTSSMGLLNIARDELIEEVDKSMGITTFLTETEGYQILFI